MITKRKLEEQRAFVKQMEDAVEHYRDNKTVSAGVLRTAVDCRAIEWGKLAQMEAEFERERARDEWIKSSHGDPFGY